MWLRAANLVAAIAVSRNSRASPPSLSDRRLRTNCLTCTGASLALVEARSWPCKLNVDEPLASPQLADSGPPSRRALRRYVRRKCARFLEAAAACAHLFWSHKAPPLRQPTALLRLRGALCAARAPVSRIAETLPLRPMYQSRRRLFGVCQNRYCRASFTQHSRTCQLFSHLTTRTKLPAGRPSPPLPSCTFQPLGSPNTPYRRLHHGE